MIEMTGVISIIIGYNDESDKITTTSGITNYEATIIIYAALMMIKMS